MEKEKRNSRLLKISAVILTLAILVGIASSCSKKEPQQEEITRGTNAIEAPANQNNNSIFGDDLLDDDTTSTTGDTSTTTAAEATTGTTKVPTTKTPSTATSPQVSEQVSQAVENQTNSSTDAATILEFINVMGYEYDPVQGIFYTNLDNWQRQANFVAHYDTAASYFNMNYRTVRIDFGRTDGMDWRVQLWKGQYGPFGGCEIGVYNKDPIENEMLYHCTDDDHLLYMESALYVNKASYETGNIFFTREWQAHWWLTGFKLRVIDPAKLIMTMRIRMTSEEMADQFEVGLLGAGFLKGDASTKYDSYRRNGNDFYILWDDLGEMNYVVRRS